jgi:hypothetical protein
MSIDNSLHKEQEDPETAEKVIKLTLELNKVREELDQVVREKVELEEEVKNRNSEMMELNEKLMMNEGSDPLAVTELQSQIDKLLQGHSSNKFDILKLKDVLERLKCDLKLIDLQQLLAKRDGEEVSVEGIYINLDWALAAITRMEE